jgi:uncharacterized protein (DUF111 family)
MAQLFAVGALDVALIPVIMKRGRPGVILSCLAACEQTDAVLEVVLQETTALGVRIQELDRQVLPRRFVTVNVTGGSVKMKIGEIGAGWEKAAPEYADCRKDVMDEARVAYSRVAPRKGKKGTRS